MRSVDSRPNTPVNVTVDAMMLKELNGMSDDDILSDDDKQCYY